MLLIHFGHRDALGEISPHPIFTLDDLLRLQQGLDRERFGDNHHAIAIPEDKIVSVD